MVWHHLVDQLVQQRLSILQVGGVEALGEPTVDFREHRPRLVAAIGIAQQPREAHGCTQFPPFGLLRSGHVERRTKTRFSLGCASGVVHQKHLALQPNNLRLIHLFASTLYLRKNIVNQPVPRGKY